MGSMMYPDHESLSSLIPFLVGLYIEKLRPFYILLYNSAAYSSLLAQDTCTVIIAQYRANYRRFNRVKYGIVLHVYNSLSPDYISDLVPDWHPS